MKEDFIILNTAEEILPYLNLLKELQPDLTQKKLETSLSFMLPMGYRMIIMKVNNEVMGLTGVWVGAKLYCGKYLEIDNFVISEKSRSQGAGKRLCEFLYALARKENCEVVMLDAYTSNTASHRFYLREGFEIKGFHFIKSL